MYKSHMWHFMLVGCLLVGGYELAAAVDFAAFDKAAAWQKPEGICCLPVVDSKNIGYCYYSQEGFLAARIEDQQERDAANRNWKKYPACKDPWCMFKKGEYVRYIRTKEQGLVKHLADQKFEMDVVGFFDVPSGSGPGNHVADGYGNKKWVGGQALPCEVDVDKNAELLGPLCIMKSEGNRKLSVIPHAQVNAAVGQLEQGNGAYVLFYETDGRPHQVMGPMPEKYIPALFKSKVKVNVGECPLDQKDLETFAKYGFEVVE